MAGAWDLCEKRSTWEEFGSRESHLWCLVCTQRVMAEGLKGVSELAQLEG